MLFMTPQRIRLLLALATAGALHTTDAADPSNPGNSGNAGKGKNEKEEKVEKPSKPEPPPKDENNSSVKNRDIDLKEEFKTQAELLQKKQKELLNQLKNANAEERAKIREQLVTVKENWKELNREFRDKLDDLKGKIDRENLGGSRGAARPRK